MVFDVELINLILYCAQQLGIALGLGAQTIMLVAYVSATRDNVIDDTEAQFLRATRNTLWIALLLMVVSGVGISILHILAGQAATVFTPAYLFKSVLIAAVILLTALLHVLPETFAEGLLGGTWYALFLVHILAPVTSWINLLTLYVVWLVGFNLIWYVVVFSTREKKAKVLVPVIKPTVKSSEALVLEKSKPVTAEAGPKELPQIRLDPVPRAMQPMAPIAPAQQIKTDPAPISMHPVEKMPASKTTDTPFLPQVPALQPIPTIPPAPGTLVVQNPTEPMLQKPEDLQQPPAPTVSPEVKRGLSVMPKSPDQIK